jgi:hypothetical protein
MMGHVVRGAMKTPVFDWTADAYNNPRIRGAIASLLTKALVDTNGHDHTGRNDIVEADFARKQAAAGGYQPITTFSQDDNTAAHG